MKHFEAPADYKKAIIAVAVVGGVGIGAGLLARRIWQCKKGGGAGSESKPTENKDSEKPSATAGQTGGTSDQTVHTKAGGSVQPESLTTSGTFEKVPLPAPESFEQLSMSQARPSTQKAGTEVKPSQPVKTDTKPSGGAAATSTLDTSRVTMKDKNDIVVVETDSSGSDSRDAKNKPSAPVMSNSPPLLPPTTPAATSAAPTPVATTPAKAPTPTVASSTPLQPSSVEPKDQTK